MEFEFKNISTLNTMYKPLPTLINEIGRTFVIDNFVNYAIDISTSKALEAPNTFEYNLNLKNGDGFFHIYSIIHNLKQNNEFAKLDKDYELTCVLELFNIIINMNVIDLEKYDYFVISNMGKYNVQFAINSGKDATIGKTLYLDIQAIRIAIIDEQVNNKFNFYYNIFNYGVKFFIGGYLLSFIQPSLIQSSLIVPSTKYITYN
jgi:hypothetical protein